MDDPIEMLDKLQSIYWNISDAEDQSFLDEINANPPETENDLRGNELQTILTLYEKYFG